MIHLITINWISRFPYRFPRFSTISITDPARQECFSLLLKTQLLGSYWYWEGEKTVQELWVNLGWALKSTWIFLRNPKKCRDVLSKTLRPWNERLKVGSGRCQNCKRYWHVATDAAQNTQSNLTNRTLTKIKQATAGFRAGLLSLGWFDPS
jgi:hypothetical protein